MGMGIDQWECEGMGILIVFPHTSTAEASLLSGSAAPVVAAGGGGNVSCNPHAGGGSPRTMNS